MNPTNYRLSYRQKDEIEQARKSLEQAVKDLEQVLNDMDPKIKQRAINEVFGIKLEGEFVSIVVKE